MDAKAQLASLTIIAGSRLQIEEATNLFGILVRSLYQEKEKQAELSSEVYKLNEHLINKMIELDSTRTAIVLAALNLANTMLEMIGDDIKHSEDKDKDEKPNATV